MADEEPKTEVEETPETEAAKPKVTKKPDKQVFQRNVDEIQAEITKLTKQMEIIQNKANEARGKKGAKGPVAEARQEMKVLRDKKKEIMDVRRELFDRREQFKAGMEQMKAQASQMKGSLGKFNTAEDIQRQLKKLETQHQTSSMTLNQEKDLIKEIETLKSMKKLVTGVSASKEKAGALKEQNKDLGQQIKEQNELLTKVNEEIDGQKAKLDKLNEKEGTKKDVFPQLMKERDELKKKIDVEYDKIRTLRTEWRENNNLWFEYSKVLRAQKQKEWEEEQARRQVEWEAKQEELAAEEAKKEPWEAEKLLCDFLVSYLEGLLPKEGGDKQEEAKEVNHLEGFTAYSKKDNDMEEFIVFGGKAKKGGKKNKKKKATTINHDLDTIQTFSQVDLTPPTTVENVAKSLQEVKDKKAWYYEQPRPDPKKKLEEANAAKNANKGPKKTNKKQDLPGIEAFPELGGGSAPAAKKAAPAAAAAKKAAPAAAAAAGGAKPYHGNEIPDDKKTYSDEAIFGQKLPGFESVDWLQGKDEALASISKGKVTCVIFWGKYAKGDYKLCVHASDLNTRFPNVQFIGVSCDAEKEDAEKLLTKIGKAMPEQAIDSFQLNFPSCYDPGKKFNSGIKRIGMYGSVGPGMSLIIDSYNNVVWKEQFSAAWFMPQGQFEEQLRRVEAGEKLMDNGARPDDGEDEEITCDVGGDEFDAFADDDGTGDY